MKKNFFIALSILSVAALTVGCGNESVIEEEVQEPAQVHAIPAKVGAARPTEDPATKASFNETTAMLEFTQDDQLLVSGTHPTAGEFSGILAFSGSNLFEGTIYTHGDATGLSYSNLLSDATSVSAQLLPKGYADAGYLSLSGTEDYSKSVTLDPAKCISTTKKAAIEQFSCEVATDYNTANNCFDLEPQNCIITFIIGGLEADETYANVKVSSPTLLQCVSQCPGPVREA